MPSPLGHALGGAVAAVLLLRSVRPVGQGPALSRLRATVTARGVVVAAVAACMPDFDFLWGRHSMETHSLGAAALAGVVAWALGGRSARFGLVVALAWTSHVAFDWLGSDDTPPLGVMALWPVTSAFYFADAYVFEAISRRYWLPGFWRHNLWAVASEIALLAPPLVAAALWRSRPRMDSGAER